MCDRDPEGVADLAELPAARSDFLHGSLLELGIRGLAQIDVDQDQRICDRFEEPPPRVDRLADVPLAAGEIRAWLAP